MSLHNEIVEIGRRASAASRALSGMTARRKNGILQAMADAIEANKSDILAANQQDLADAANEGLPEGKLDRLLLNEARVVSLVRALRAVAALKDPIGTNISRWIRPSGLEIVKRRVPIGVIAVLFESLPRVAVDASALCLKTANSIVLRGGKEARRSTETIVTAITNAGREKGMPEHAVQLIESSNYDAISELLAIDDCVDMVVARGGEEMVRAVRSMSNVPVITHSKGVCHTYVDETADVEVALKIAENAKCQQPAVCNAMETLVVHEGIAAQFLPMLTRLMAERGVELRGDEASRTFAEMGAASEDDWRCEYLSEVLAVRVVANVDEAVTHINRYGSHLADAIVAEADAACKKFLREVDSAAVYVNASTRFTDSAEFGMGAELGISTDKLHARGPVGLEELTTYKYVVTGKGQVRE